MTQSRLGADPLGKLFGTTAGEKPAAAKPKPAPKTRPAAAAKPGTAEARIIERMGQGRAKNYYLRGRDAEKELLQKVLIYLPLELVSRLKKEAIDEGCSLSALIQQRLGG